MRYKMLIFVSQNFNRITSYRILFMSTAIDHVLPAILEQRALNKKETKYFKQVAKALSRKKPAECTADEALVLGYMYENQGNDDMAIEAYSKSIEENPEFEAAYKFRGAAYLRNKNYAEGEIDLNKALEIDPEYSDAILELASLKYEAGSYEEAEELVNRVLSTDEENALANALLGSILDKHEKYDEALAAFDKAVSIQPEDGQLKMQRGIVRFFAGDKEGALEDIKECRKVSGSHQVLQFNFGLVYVTMEGYEKEAYRNFEKAFKKEPNILKNYLAEAQDFEADRLIDTLRDALKRIENSSDDAGAFYRKELLELLKSKLP